MRYNLSLTETAWEKLDDSLHLRNRLSDGENVRVSASVMKRITKREPRLLTKFDTRGHRPRVLRNATILPVSNGEYLILPGDGYHEIEAVSDVSRWVPEPMALALDSLPWNDGPSSEGQLIDMAHSSGLLGDFLGEPHMYLTIRGRLRSPSFKFSFPATYGATEVDVAGVQIEVDAGYEGQHLNLVEAKLGKWSDFHVRQLYYPLRMWQELLPNKSSRSVFISYSDRVISLRLYDFKPPDNYGAIHLAKAADFVLDSTDQPFSLDEILSTTKLLSAPSGVTFPQADDMQKVLDLVDATAAGIISKSETMLRYGFTERQALYYTTAARYIGLIEPYGSGRVLTPLGQQFSRATRSQRHRIIVERLAALPVFRSALEHAASNESNLPPIDTMAEWIAETSSKSGLPLSGSTLSRRAATVRNWTQWALDITGSTT